MNKKVLALLLVLVMAFSLTTGFAPVFAAEPPDVGPLALANVALNKPATASSVHPSLPDSTPDKAVDGQIVKTGANAEKNPYRWASQRATGVAGDYNSEYGPAKQWLEIDLQGIYAVDEIKLYWEGGYAAQYDIEGSLDGEVYFTIASKSPTTAEDATFSGLDIRARYVKINCNTPFNAQWGYSLYEAEVYGALVEEVDADKAALQALYDGVRDLQQGEYADDLWNVFVAARDEAGAVLNDGEAGQPQVDAALAALQAAYDALRNSIVTGNPNLALNKPVEVSGTEVTDGRFTGPMAVDGINDATNRWSAAKTDSQWLVVDLGQVYELQQFDIYFHAESPVWSLEISEDGQSYTQVHSFDEGSYYNTGLTVDRSIILPERQPARYVRYVQSKMWQHSGNNNYYSSSIRELEVYQYMRTDAATVLAAVTALPTLSPDGTKLILPELVSNEYTVALYGCDNQQVITMEGDIITPLVDMPVNLLYKVTSKTDPADTATSEADVKIVVPGSTTPGAGDNAKPEVMPGLREWKGGAGSFTLAASPKLVFPAGQEAVAALLAEYFEDMLGAALTLAPGGTAGEGDIALALDAGLAELGNEGYLMEITEGLVSIKAPTAKGLQYGGASITQILYQSDGKNTAPVGTARDYPKYPIRAGMLDVGRMYIPLDYVEELGQYMSYYKMNEFHVHINDYWGNSGYTAFRLENEKYPLITATDGSYTKEEYRQFQKNLANYGIDVITEIDSPYHAESFRPYVPMMGAGQMDIRTTENYDKVMTFMKDLFDEYLDGDNPVFQGGRFHIGTDEYNRAYGEQMRKYTDELIKYVNAKGRETRLWGSLGSKGFNGTTPVSNEAVVNLWAPYWADVKETYAAGYDIINTVGGFIYIVPGANAGYPDRWDDRTYQGNLYSRTYLYNNFNANNFSPTRNAGNGTAVMPIAHPQTKGASFAVWNDMTSFFGGFSEFDIYDRMKDAVMLLSEKTWYGEQTEGQTAEQYIARAESLQGRAPGANPGRYVDSKTDTMMDYGDMAIEGGKVADASGNGYDATVNNGAAVAEGGVSFNGDGYLSLPTQSIGYPYTVNFKVKLDEIPADTVLFTGEDGTLYANIDGTGKLGYQRGELGTAYTFHFNNSSLKAGEWATVALTCGIKNTALFINGVRVASAGTSQRATINNRANDSNTFVLPTEKILDGAKGSINKLSAYNRVLSDAEIAALADGEAPKENIALKKPVIYVDQQDDTNAAAKVNDGDLDTRWAGAYINNIPKYPNWIAIDLGAYYDLEEVELYFFQYGLDSRAYKYEVMTLDKRMPVDDLEAFAAAFTQVYDNRSNTDRNGHYKHDVTGATARYIMVNVTSSDAFESGNNYALPSIYEILATGELADTQKYLVSGKVSSEGIPVEGLTVGLYAAADTDFENALATAAVSADGSYTLYPDFAPGSYVARIAGVSGSYGEATTDVTLTNADVTNAGLTVYAMDGKAALRALYDLVVGYVEDDYAAVTWVPFKAARDAAKAVLDDGAATPEAIEAALDALQTAVDGLEARITNAALNKPVSASSHHPAANLVNSTPDKAVDGDATTRWASQRATGRTNAGDGVYRSEYGPVKQWLQVDLEGVYRLDNISINWEGGCGREYYVRGSLDGTTYFDIAHVTDGAAGIRRFEGLEDEVRFVLVDGVTPVNNMWGYSIFELEVNGELVQPVESDFRVATYNIAAGYTPRPSLEAQAQQMDELGVDFAGLQEVDKNTGRNNYDMLAKFVETSSFTNGYFGKAIDHDGGDYGIGQVFHVAPVESDTVQLVTPAEEEQRVYQRSVIEVGGRQVAFYNTHLSWESTAIRAAQMEQLKAAVDADPIEYRVLVGDFNIDQTTEEWAFWTGDYNLSNGKDGRWFTTFSRYDGDMVVYSIDNIIVSKNMAVDAVATVTNLKSDHFMLYADISFAESSITKKDLEGLYQELTDGISYDPEKYTVNSWNRFDAALKAAKAVLAEAVPTPAAITAAYSELYAAADGLALRGDVMTLEIMYLLYSTLDPASHTAASWAPMQAALDTARALLDDPDNASVQDVADALNALADAQDGLKWAVLTGPLKQQVAEAKKVLENKNDYIALSVEKLEEALAEAEALLAGPEEAITKDAVEAACKKLQGALEVMFEKGDIRGLKLLVDYAELLSENLYTAESWAAFKPVLEEAKKAVVANDALPGEVTDLYNRLSQAISKLEPATNKNGLKTALEVAKTVLDNAASYIPASIAGLQAAYDKANATYNTAGATQDEVDKAQKELMAEALKARKPANKELLKQGLGRAANLQGLSQAAIEAAQALLDAPDAVQADVDAAYNNLRDAMDNARNTPVIAQATISENQTAAAPTPVGENAKVAAPAEIDPYMTPAQPMEDSGQAPALPEMEKEQMVSVEQAVDNVASGMWTVALIAAAGLCLLLALALLARRRKNRQDK